MVIDLKVAADGPSPLLEPLPERRGASLSFRIVLDIQHQHANAPYPTGLLCARRKRPHRGRATKQPDKLPPRHSITSVARASMVGGIVRSRAFAVLRLIAKLKLVDTSTGSSAGFSPLRMRAV